MKAVRNGRIGLLDLQRPFIYRDNKVLALFDSMLKGYPIDYITKIAITAAIRHPTCYCPLTERGRV